MCYYSFFLFVQCGHLVSSQRPIKRAPSCPLESDGLFEHPSHASPVLAELQLPHGYEPLDPTAGSVEEEKKEETKCTAKLSHPLHTYRIDSMCRTCQVEKETRIARFEIACIRENIDRGFSRVRPKHKVEVHGKKPRTLRAGYEAGKLASQHGQIHGQQPHLKSNERTGKEENVVGEKADRMKSTDGGSRSSNQPVSYYEDTNEQWRHRYYSSLQEWEAHTDGRSGSEGSPQRKTKASSELMSNGSPWLDDEMAKSERAASIQSTKTSPPMFAEPGRGFDSQQRFPNGRYRSMPNSPGFATSGKPKSPASSFSRASPSPPLRSPAKRKNTARSDRSGRSLAGNQVRNVPSVEALHEASWMARDYG